MWTVADRKLKVPVLSSVDSRPGYLVTVNLMERNRSLFLCQRPKDIIKLSVYMRGLRPSTINRNYKQQSLIQMSFSSMDCEFSKMAFFKNFPVITEVTVYFNIRLKLIGLTFVFSFAMNQL